MNHQLTPKMLGQAIGVSESSLKRWSDEGLLEVTRTAGGHRRIAVQEAVRFIRESNQSLIRPDILNLPDLQSESARSKPSTHRPQAFTQSLLEGNTKSARGIILDEYLSGRPLAQTCDELIAPAMKHLGELWNHSEEGIFLEHRATDICIQAINHVRSLMLTRQPDAGPIAIGAAPAGDPYLLPTTIASAVLASEGWSAINIGPNTPWSVLALSAQTQKAVLVWVSLSVSIPAKQLERQLKELAESLSAHGGHLVIGGRESSKSAGALPNNTVSLNSMVELAAYAKGLASQPGRGGT